MAHTIVADDDQGSRGINVELILRLRPETQIDEASDGQQLVNMVRSTQYDLIITDHVMPVLSGLMAIKEIRRFDRNTPICMVSGSEIEVQALQAGATDYVEKGMGPAGLIKILEKYL